MSSSVSSFRGRRGWSVLLALALAAPAGTPPPQKEQNPKSTLNFDYPQEGSGALMIYVDFHNPRLEARQGEFVPMAATGLGASQVVYYCVMASTDPRGERLYAIPYDGYQMNMKTPLLQKYWFPSGDYWLMEVVDKRGPFIRICDPFDFECLDEDERTKLARMKKNKGGIDTRQKSDIEYNIVTKFRVSDNMTTVVKIFTEGGSYVNARRRQIERKAWPRIISAYE